MDHRGIVAKPNRSRHQGGDVFPWSIHAEAAVLKGHAKRGGRIYIARLTPGGRLGLAKPCPRCVAALREAGINRVVWTTSTGVDSAKVRDLSTDMEDYYDLTQRSRH